MTSCLLNQPTCRDTKLSHRSINGRQGMFGHSPPSPMGPPIGRKDDTESPGLARALVVGFSLSVKRLGLSVVGSFVFGRQKRGIHLPVIKSVDVADVS